ncbi:hypothetical protein DT070_06020 [Polaromonas sp. SP1]|nr:hypothetical protein DT070_06020 [Polaromonas sp. SP1]
MAGNRILILGIPGVKKSVAANALATKLETLRHNYRVVNFESEYLWQRVQQRARFLDAPIYVQHEMWLDAWNRFSAQFVECRRNLTRLEQ